MEDSEQNIRKSTPKKKRDNYSTPGGATPMPPKQPPASKKTPKPKELKQPPKGKTTKGTKGMTPIGTPDYDDDVRIDITPETNPHCKQGNVKKVFYIVFFVTVIIIIAFIIFSIYVGEESDNPRTASGRRSDDIELSNNDNFNGNRQRQGQQSDQNGNNSPGTNGIGGQDSWNSNEDQSSNENNNYEPRYRDPETTMPDSKPSNEQTDGGADSDASNTAQEENVSEQQKEIHQNMQKCSLLFPSSDKLSYCVACTEDKCIKKLITNAT